MNKFKILIVDDEATNIDYLAHVFKPFYTVLVAKNGETALHIARAQKPDLILLDIIMPGKNGFDVLAELKASEETSKTPVIFITGRDSAEDEEKGFALGAADYITKPFYNSTVIARVRTQLRMVEYIREIERLGMTDSLTNLPNRRAFDLRVNHEWERAIREKTPVSVLMVDIDKFKAFNDNYGHSCGDELLKTVAAVFEQTLKRPADFASRWGGDEFAILLPNTDMQGAMEIGSQLMANAANAPIMPAEGRTPFKLLISVGVNSECPVVGNSVDDFVSKADKALYSSKQKGGGIVRSFEQ